MWCFVLTMLTSPSLPFILSVCVALAEAAPGGSIAVLSLSSLNLAGSAQNQAQAQVQAQTRAQIQTQTQTRSAVVAFALRTPIDAPAVTVITTTIEPPTTDPTTPSTKPPLPPTGNDGKAAAMVAEPLGRKLQNIADITAGDPFSTSDSSRELVCNCSGEGVLYPDECDRETGQCMCMVGYTGPQCEECEDDHFTNGTTDCQPCGCDSFGAVSSRCDSTGTCVCKTGVYGPKCDDCHHGFYHFSSTGCQPCQCNEHSNYCHPQSGVCLDCQDNTQGQNCEECVPGFYRALGSGVKDGCVSCPCATHRSTGTCHLDASGRPVCDECKASFGGQTCDVCVDGFYKLADACVRCDCSGNSDPLAAPQICHPESGRCLRCANNTTGTHCELCAPGYEGDARAHNCSRRASRLLPTLPPRTGSPGSTAALPPPPPLFLLTPSPPSSSSSSSPPSSSSSSSNVAPPPTLQSGPSPGSGSSSESSSNNSTASALTVVSWTQFNVIVLAVVTVLVVLLMALVGGVYSYREYQNRKLNAPFWTIELKEDNISFSSYHDSIPPHAEPNGLLEDEPCAVAANGQLALATAANMYKA